MSEDSPRTLWPPTGVLAALVLIGLVTIALHWREQPAPQPERPPIALRGKVRLNHAPPRTLALLPGIGNAIGHNIAETRQRQGAFHNPAQLERVNDIGPVRRSRMTPWVTFVTDNPGPQKQITTGVHVTIAEAAR